MGNLRRMQKRKRIWKKGDVIVPRLNNCPKRDTSLTIVEVKSTGYYVEENKKKELIEHKYLEDSYISEKGLRVYTWILYNTEGEDDGQRQDSNRNKRPRGEKLGSTKTDNSVQEVSNDGPVRKRSRRAPDSSSIDQIDCKCT